MNKFNLQLFATEALAGKQLVYLYRDLEKQATESAGAISFVTQNERTSSKTANSTATKDGSIRTPGTDSTEITSASVMPKDDPQLEMLEDCYENDKIIEVWEINRDKPKDDKTGAYEAYYMHGYITQLRKTSAAGNNATVNITVGVTGNKAKGYATLTKEQEELADVVFADTQPAKAAGATTGGE